MSSKVEEREVRVIEVRMLHDGCDGEMKFDGMSKPSNPPYNLHICTFATNATTENGYMEPPIHISSTSHQLRRNFNRGPLYEKIVLRRNDDI